jgi:glycerol-3-phosphate dehydrogenase
VWAVREEHCVKLTDFLWRRTRLAFTVDQGRQAARPAADWLARELGWTDARREAELGEYEACVEATQRFRSE